MDWIIIEIGNLKLKTNNYTLKFSKNIAREPRYGKLYLFNLGSLAQTTINKHISNSIDFTVFTIYNICMSDTN